MPRKKPVKTSTATVDPERMAEIGRVGGLKTRRRRGKAWFSELAKRSHPKNNPKAKRKKYAGGRPKLTES